MASVLVVWHISTVPDDCGFVQCYLLMALSFPSAWLWLAAIAGLEWVSEHLFGWGLPSGTPAGVLLVATIIALGYFQWFLLLPRLPRLWARKTDHAVMNGHDRL